MNATTSETSFYLEREKERKKENNRKRGGKKKEKLSRCILRSDSFSGINARMQRRKNISWSNSLLQHAWGERIIENTRWKASPFESSNDRNEKSDNLIETCLKRFLIRRWKTFSSFLRFKKVSNEIEWNHSMVRNDVFRTYFSFFLLSFFFSFFFFSFIFFDEGNKMENVYTTTILFLRIS